MAIGLKTPGKPADHATALDPSIGRTRDACHAPCPAHWALSLWPGGGYTKRMEMCNPLRVLAVVGLVLALAGLGACGGGGGSTVAPSDFVAATAVGQASESEQPEGAEQVDDDEHASHEAAAAPGHRPADDAEAAPRDADDDIGNLDWLRPEGPDEQRHGADPPDEPGRADQPWQPRGPAADTAIEPEEGPVGEAPDDNAAPPVTLESLEQWAETEAPGPGRGAVTVNAMIGQVNARPIYASDVLEQEHEQLQALAERVSRSRFRQEAQQIVASRLVSIVRDELMLADARRELSQRQRQGLEAQVREQRKELLRRYGRGSETRADSRLRELRGIGLEDALEEYRQVLLLGHFRHQRFAPRVHVSRRDIERHYEDNYETYNPEPSRRIHMIRVANALAANRVDQLLEEQPFEEVARQRMNMNNPDREGYFGTFSSDSPFGAAALNEALLALDEGEHSDRIELRTDEGREYYWIYLDSIEEGERRPLDGEVQLEIAQKLRQEQISRLWNRYQEELMREGNFKPVEQMTAEVLAIAEALYLPRR